MCRLHHVCRKRGEATAVNEAHIHFDGDMRMQPRPRQSLKSLTSPLIRVTDTRDLRGKALTPSARGRDFSQHGTLPIYSFPLGCHPLQISTCLNDCASGTYGSAVPDLRLSSRGIHISFHDDVTRVVPESSLLRAGNTYLINVISKIWLIPQSRS